MRELKKVSPVGIWIWIMGELGKKLYTEPGANLGFSRGGGAEFQNIFKNFDDFFLFRSTKLIFWPLLKQ